MAAVAVSHLYREKPGVPSIRQNGASCLEEDTLMRHVYRKEPRCPIFIGGNEVSDLYRDEPGVGCI